MGVIDVPPIRVMFVCLGNICRSPLAQGIFEDLLHASGLSDRFEVSSSGIGAWHIGQKPDLRMRRTAERHGVSLDDQRAQQLKSADLMHYDHIYAMDRRVERDVLRRAPTGKGISRIHCFSQYDPDPNTLEVPDPYFENNFEEVYTIVERTCRELLKALILRYGLTG